MQDITSYCIIKGCPNHGHNTVLIVRLHPRQCRCQAQRKETKTIKVARPYPNNGRNDRNWHYVIRSRVTCWTICVMLLAYTWLMSTKTRTANVMNVASHITWLWSDREKVGKTFYYFLNIWTQSSWWCCLLNWISSYCQGFPNLLLFIVHLRHLLSNCFHAQLPLITNIFLLPFLHNLLYFFTPCFRQVLWSVVFLRLHTLVTLDNSACYYIHSKSFYAASE